MFLFRKRQEMSEKNGCCQQNQAGPDRAETEKAKSAVSAVKVLGSGCAKCNQLEAATAQALRQLGMDEKIEHVTDFAQIAAYGVMSTPALVVDGKVVSYGKVLKADDVVRLIRQVRG